MWVKQTTHAKNYTEKCCKLRRGSRGGGGNYKKDVKLGSLVTDNAMAWWLIQIAGAYLIVGQAWQDF